MKKGRINWKILIICLVIVYIVAFAGSLFTNTGNWYESIKPSITPPNYIFPIVWNILFFLIALSLYFAWINTKKGDSRKRIVLAFGINLALNLLWSFLFFKMHNPIASFYELIILWLSIIFMIYITNKSSRLSSYLLFPYFLWVSFAGILNYLIVF